MQTVPVVAPLGTVVLIVVSVCVNDAAVPLNFTEFTFASPRPLIVTGVPTAPQGGENGVVGSNSGRVAAQVDPAPAS